MEIVIFDPFVDKAQAAYLVDIHRKEIALLDDCLPNQMIVGESEDEEPIFATTDVSSVDHEAIILKHAINFPSLMKANNDCKLSFVLPLDTINYFTDAAMIDLYFLDGLNGDVNRTKLAYDVKCIMLLIDKEYSGHVWFFTKRDDPKHCGLYGMKSSLVNVIVRTSCKDVIEKRKGIAAKILMYGVSQLAAGRTIVVPWPLPPMVPILEKFGFKSVRSTDPTPEKVFLDPLTSTNEYYVLDFIRTF